MFDAKIQEIEPKQIIRYSLTQDGGRVRFSEALDLWESSADFRSFFTKVLIESPFSAFRWETPALTESNAARDFEFVLLDEPAFCSRPTDKKTFAKYFAAADANAGVTSFPSLGRDSILIVPSLQADTAAYGHLSAFVRRAPPEQIDALWRLVGKLMKSQLSDRPVWLSTAGGGVAWLHVRLDSRPKYYGYAPYRNV